jgi:predicted DNA-binding transcriptional regulator AlpA
MKTSKRYLDGQGVRARYGGRSHMWIYRRLHDASGFPKPIVIASRNYWDEEKLDAYDAASRASHEKRGAS